MTSPGSMKVGEAVFKMLPPDCGITPEMIAAKIEQHINVSYMEELIADQRRIIVELEELAAEDEAVEDDA